MGNEPMEAITQMQYIIRYPHQFIGSVQKETHIVWIYEEKEMIHRALNYSPGLFKIFEEIILNAADNKQRDPSMDSLKVDIDVEANCISIYNNGDGIPVEIHQKEGVYVPEMMFGQLLTSSSYGPYATKTTGGRFGYGAKLTNIFSTEFTIQTADGKRQYTQVFSQNMETKSQPSIAKCKEGENWTKVTFKPDLVKFNMEYLEEDVVALMKKRVVDLAGTLCKTVKVVFNGERVAVETFADYVNFYLQFASKFRHEPLPRIVEKVNDRWEIIVSLSDGQFQQVSFVNSVNTISGGTHVEYVTNQITSHVANILNENNKKINIKAHHVKNYLWVFINCLVDDPIFYPQTKETLISRQESFGSKCDLSQDFLNKVAKIVIVESPLSWDNFKHDKELNKTDGTKRGKITGILSQKESGIAVVEEATKKLTKTCDTTEPIAIDSETVQEVAKEGPQKRAGAARNTFKVVSDEDTEGEED